MPKTKTSSPKNLRIPKVILITAKIFAFISTKLVTRFAAKLFVTPIKHKTPKREHEMESKSKKQIIKVAVINKEIMTISALGLIEKMAYFIVKSHVSHLTKMCR